MASDAGLRQNHPGAQGGGATSLLLVRHGESAANVAATAAEAAGAEIVDMPLRDADVPLTRTGTEQALALRRWLDARPPGEYPDSVWVSPYLRAAETAGIALAGRSDGTRARVDERLRDRELGVLDLLTGHGVDRLLPDEAARRRWLGKFYYRPPGGESWADVALRVRSLLGDLDAGADAAADAPAPVMITAHDAVVMVFIYVCLGLSEGDLLQFAQTNVVSNASVTRLVRPSGTGPWTLEAFSHDEHIRETGVPVTEHAGDKDADIH